MATLHGQDMGGTLLHLLNCFWWHFLGLTRVLMSHAGAHQACAHQACAERTLRSPLVLLAAPAPSMTEPARLVPICSACLTPELPEAACKLAAASARDVLSAAESREASSL